jgi:hypothetical protein
MMWHETHETIDSVTRPNGDLLESRELPARLNSFNRARLLSIGGRFTIAAKRKNGVAIAGLIQSGDESGRRRKIKTSWTTICNTPNKALSGSVYLSRILRKQSR